MFPLKFNPITGLVKKKQKDFNFLYDFYSLLKETPLYDACYAGDHEIVKLLLAHPNTNPTEPDDQKVKNFKKLLNVFNSQIYFRIMFYI